MPRTPTCAGARATPGPGAGASHATVRSPSNAWLPDLPGRFATVPEFVQHVFLFQRVHAGPKPIVLIAHQFPILRHVFDRIPLPDGLIAIDIVQGTTVEEEIP